MSHHYAIVAAKLIEQCLDQIQSIIDTNEQQQQQRKSHSNTSSNSNSCSSSNNNNNNSSLYDMKVVLADVESHLYHYLYCIIEKEVETSLSITVQEQYKNIDIWASDLRSQVEYLQFILKESNIAATTHAALPTHSYYPRRSATDSLLFRLNVALQLCLVRIDDARLVICGERYNNNNNNNNQQSSQQSGGIVTPTTTTMVVTSARSSHHHRPYLYYYTVAGLLGATTLVTTYTRRYHPESRLGRISIDTMNWKMYAQPIIMHSSKLIISICTLQWIHTKWSNKWMTTKLIKSTEEIEEWIRQWIVIQSTPTPKSIPTITITTPSSFHSNIPVTKSHHTIPPPPPSQQHFHHHHNHSSSTNSTSDIMCNNNSLDAARSRRLIEYALQESAKNTFWHSQGELRFLMVKRAMDVFYASVGTAGHVIGHHNNNKEQTGKNAAVVQLQLTLVTAAVASFYSVIGARDKAAAVTSSSESANYLIRNAWGMVSLPAVKNLSLQASRLIKGAAVADRIEICGIPCFILSSDPAPELAAAIKRSHRTNHHQRRVRKPFATLSTIDEQEEHTPSCNSHRSQRADGGTASSFVRSSSRRYRQRDVIFHLTGGGFFAHIHSTDLPYLLDWSAATGAVVICPEYALLPEHTFPVALHEVELVYEALVSDELVSVLGFETNRIIVTGESAGGNLAASLCVKICMDEQNSSMDILMDDNYHVIGKEAVTDSTGSTSPTTHDSQSNSYSKLLDTSAERNTHIRLPDALMLSCPVLNLSLEMSHSRVIGNDDPVLPSGLISAISDAYVPSHLGICKKDPLASPFYASNDILRHFPPTLLFASSNDPLLDDSVVFNQRLREHGVESDLIAAHNLPHAYLGLGTAGFPEAKQIQEQCMIWLNEQFTKPKKSYQ